MMIHHGLLPHTPKPFRCCPTCEGAVERRQIKVPKGITCAVAFRWFCPRCRKFAQPKITSL